ncbi:nucleoside triphosphate pyrophosphohydrolase [Parapedomonas caeni]
MSDALHQKLRDSAATAFAALVDVMARLRNPDGGCPWDLEQSFATIAPYTIEEAYEVADAIASGDRGALREELGDLLLQVVYHARMAEEEGAFHVADVVEGITAKMIRRHPHVFGEAQVATAAEQTAAWDAMKAAERTAKAAPAVSPSALDGVASALPALMRAQKVQARAARVGFDWPDAAAVLPKIAEELAETRDAMASDDVTHQMEEVGDLLFAVVNLARKLDIDAETALKAATDKFDRRFRAMEQLADSRPDSPAFADLDLDAMEALWQAVKKAGAAG